MEEPVESEVEEEESSKSESAKRGEIPPIPAPPIPPKACIIIRSFNVESSEFEFIIDSINGLNPIVDAARHAKSFIVGLIVAKIYIILCSTG